MNIILKRTRHRPDTIDGNLWIDGLKVCDCAENAHHCLPPGTYRVELVKSERLGRKLPSLITSRSPLTANHPSLIMPGNGVYALRDGSIIVGQHCVPGIVTHSRLAFDTLYGRIRKAIERGHSVTLTIL